MEKKNIRCIGLICLLFMLAFAITTISLAGVHFRYTSTTWTKHGWGALGATELASIIFVWILIPFGAIAFCTMNKACLTVFALVNLLSFGFTLAIVIFSFIGTLTRSWDESLGCNAQYQGLFKAWESVDTYLQTVDSLFCTSRCKCYFNSTTSALFTSSSISLPYIGQWSVTDKRHESSVRFQDCPKDVVDDAFNQYVMKNAYYNHTFRPDWFHIYWNHIEEYFKCTGFCGTTYFDETRGTNQKIVKYLFSDVARGIPEHIGCLPVLLDWLMKTLNAFAAVGCFLALIQFILVVLATALCCIMRKDGDYDHNKKYTNDGNHPISSSRDLVDKSKAKQKQKKQETPLENNNDSQREKERQREVLRNKEKELLSQKKKDNEKKIKEGQTPGQYAYELGNIDSSFIPSDAQKNESEFKFNPSIKP